LALLHDVKKLQLNFCLLPSISLPVGMQSGVQSSFGKAAKTVQKMPAGQGKQFFILQQG
jgi:hypothetical protein